MPQTSLEQGFAAQCITRRRSICKLLIDKPFPLHTARKCTESTMTPDGARRKAVPQAGF